MKKVYLKPCIICVKVNGSQLAKIKKNIPNTCPCHKIYRVVAVGLKRSNYTFKIMISVNI